MTIKDFIKVFKIKESTVTSWLEKELLPGSYKNVKTDIWHIPEDARPPYVERRSKGGKSVYTSIVRGTLKGKNVFPELYDMTPQRFNIYIQELIKAQLITSYEAEDIIYYEPTPITNRQSSLNYNKLNKFILDAIEAGAKGVAAAFLNHI